jgi:hypothetical protein
MHDEFATEDSSLGHGIFTYCLSVRQSALGSSGAIGVLPDNSRGPSLALAAGVRGCSFLTAGSQNPVTYWNGAGHLEVSQSGFSIVLDDDQVLTDDQMLEQLLRKRDQVRSVMESARPDLRVQTGISDDEMRHSIKQTLEFIVNSRGGTSRAAL